jgi:hypothetical protein
MPHSSNFFPSATPLPRAQSGAALFLLLLLILVGAGTIFVSQLKSADVELEAQRKTAAALAEAKRALLGYAASQGGLIGNARPGDLPCPAADENGNAAGSCGNAAGTTGQSARLGRLPWRTLGLPDLRDGHGELLWYAVSANYKNNTRLAILNSDTAPGTITVRNRDGLIVMDGSGTTGAIAVVIAPGAALQRADGTVQNRGGAGANFAQNFLDVALGEDNADFTDRTANGFISGNVRNAAGDIMVNDHVATISYEELMPLIEIRVAREIRSALRDHAITQAKGFPTPAAFADTSCLAAAPENLLDNTLCASVPGTRGRIPANPPGGWAGDASFFLTGGANWFQRNRWRELVYYVVAPPMLQAGSTGGVQALVIVSGRTLTNTQCGAASMALQQRATNPNKADVCNYLDSTNNTNGGVVFDMATVSATYNDRTVIVAP